MPRSESTVSHPPAAATRQARSGAAAGPRSPGLVQHLLLDTAVRQAARPALRLGPATISYGEMARQVEAAATGLVQLGLGPGDRVAIFLPKTVEAVVSIFGTALAGGVFVPINPVLKATQVAHVLQDSGARILITSAARLAALADILPTVPALDALILSDNARAPGPGPRQLCWSDLTAGGTSASRAHARAPDDLAALFYTSGSTGRAKGVMLSHRNIVTGAASVAGYLANGPEDRILALLPLSFDAGFSQLTTGFLAGAEVTLLDYLLPGDVVRVIAEHGITGITGVPPLWAQLADVDWPPAASGNVRYFATTGGVMPRALLDRLRQLLPAAAPYLMYGLTEAFRSTYLPPEEIERRPDSIGKAIPDAEILVLRDDGTPAAPGEPGELVHRGPLVALGYWNAPALTAERFRPLPAALAPGATPEVAVWSGDTVVRDTEGFLYFRGRRDDMLKSSGYRISPTEVEELVLASGLVSEAVVVGVPDARLGQALVLLAVPRERAGPAPTAALWDYCREALPGYLVPARIDWRKDLARNANGKYDRAALRAEAEAAT